MTMYQCIIFHHALCHHASCYIININLMVHVRFGCTVMFVLFYITTYVSLNFTQLGGLHMYAMLFATSFKVVVIVFILSKYLWSKSGILELCELGEVENLDPTIYVNYINYCCFLEYDNCLLCFTNIPLWWKYVFFNKVWTTI